MDLNHIGTRIITYANLLNTFFLEDYKNFLAEEFADLSTKQRLILELIKGKAQTINGISTYFSISASAASQFVSKLEKQGYVQREINLENRREIIVQLAEKGKRYSKMIEQIQRKIIEKYFTHLPEEELTQLLSIYEKLYHIAIHVNDKDNGGT